MRPSQGHRHTGEGRYPEGRGLRLDGECHAGRRRSREPTMPGHRPALAMDQLSSARTGETKWGIAASRGMKSHGRALSPPWRERTFSRPSPAGHSLHGGSCAASVSPAAWPSTTATPRYSLRRQQGSNPRGCLPRQAFTAVWPNSPPRGGWTRPANWRGGSIVPV